MSSEETVPVDQAELTMHAAMTIGGDILMASDDPREDPGKRLCRRRRGLSGVSEALADDEEVTMPRFGMYVTVSGLDGQRRGDTGRP